MIANDKKFIVSLKMQKEYIFPWEEIKKRLVHQMAEVLIPPMVDSGNYHVVKFDMIKREPRPDNDLFLDYVEYGIIAKLSVAQQQRVTYATMQPLDIEYRSQGYKRVCNYCGNALTLDHRGGCNACGAPNGGYK